MLSKIKETYLKEIMQIKILYNNTFVLHAQSELYC